MSQVSLLSVDASQSSDTKGNVEKFITKKQTSESTFLSVMEQHYHEPGIKNSADKARENGNHEPKMANEVDPVGNLAEKIKESGSEESYTQPVPVAPALPQNDNNRSDEKTHSAIDGAANSGKAALSMGGEHQQRNTDKQVSTNEDEAVDLLKMLVGAQKLITKGVTENKSLEQAKAVNQSVAEATEQKLVVKEGGANNKFIEQGKIASEMNTRIIEQKSIDDSKAEKKSTEQVKPSSQVAVEGAAKQQLNIAQQDKKIAASETEKNNLTKASQENNEQLAQKKLKTQNSSNLAQLASNVKNNEMSPSNKTKQVNDELPQGNKTKQVSLKNDAVLGKSEEKEPDIDAKVTQTIAEKISLSDKEKPKFHIELPKAPEKPVAQQDKADGNAALSSTSSPLLKAENNSTDSRQIHQAIPEAKEFSTHQESIEVLAENHQTLSSEALKSEPNSSSSHTRVINQSTSVAVGTLASKELTQSLEANESKHKATDESNEEINVSKNAVEQKTLMPEKAISMVNQTIEAQASRPTMSSAEIATQQEQSFESTLSKLSTTTVQTQKSITTLNTETIAIYRKDFANAVKEKVMVMINQKIQQVEIQLDPPEMGNVHIRVNLQNEQAAVQFIVQNQQAKDALEQNMGKLRDMLAESDVDVGDTNIEQRQPGEQSELGSNGEGNKGQGKADGEQELAENREQVGNLFKAASTGVDYYA